MPHEVLLASGWPTAMGMAIVRTEAPTCGAVEFDYLLVDSRAHLFANEARPYELGTKPHLVVAPWAQHGFRVQNFRQMLALSRVVRDLPIVVL